MKRAALGALLALLWASPLQAAQSVPLVMLGDGHFGVNVSLAGKAPTMFAIDTGAGMDYAPATLVSALGLKPTGTYDFLSFTGKSFNVPTYVLPPVRVGGVSIPDTHALDWDGLDRFSVPPLLSLWSFMDEPVTIDVPNKTLTFEDADSFAARIRGAERIPLSFFRDRNLLMFAFVDVDFGDGQRGQCILDTGSGGTMIDARFMPALGMKTGDPGVVSYYSDQAEGRRTQYNGKVPYLALAAAPTVREANPGVGFVKGAIYDCVLGNDFWADKVFTLDLAHGQMYVAASQPG